MSPVASRRAELWELVENGIRLGLSQDDPGARRAAAGMIEYVPEASRAELWELVENGIRLALSQDDPGARKEAAWAIRHAPVASRAELVRLALSQDDPGARMAAAGMIQHVPEESRAELVRKSFDVGLGNEIIKPALYEGSTLDGGRFKLAKFAKTGSETTLVGGALKDKLIVRHISPGPFIAWQKIYEDHGAWQRNGFDYVPVEPIHSYLLDKKKGMVDVFSGVLDLSLASWLRISGDMYEQELENQRDKIINVLKQEGVAHGHTHRDNFVLRFFRDKNGNPDIDRVPRVYVIDFDQAVSPVSTL
ncbi:hypothetical protein A2304_03205 [Candidatus Uhrbacteria bacterium RIFOXYB2_FULL_57_15]|uniref:Uncharacterized protein n=1 Tax=Candidatus Uhrbacteria bacterium RIFOXYB2_FULL_57_15 TaxID=1802422 RepID=A0A1F7W6A9_9BACT|nr:MAG: hypothetical protein A2304_03205 [Candidatus Uhrbacteria bacterium RIFOXYB2_FULL_57_15]